MKKDGKEKAEERKESGKLPREREREREYLQYKTSKDMNMIQRSRSMKDKIFQKMIRSKRWEKELTMDQDAG